MSRRPARATKADIRRAVETVREAGANMSVEILPNGVIRIVPTEALDLGRGDLEDHESGGDNPWDA